MIACGVKQGQIMRVYGVTGRKNSGKTTLVEKLLRELTARGYRVSTVKRAHHDADIDQPGRDSYRHREAGAHEVLFASPGRWALMHELRDEDEPELAAHLQRLGRVDLVLVEGFKHAGHPKLEVWRQATGTTLLAPEIATIRGLVSDQGDGGTGLPVMQPDDVSAIADFIVRESGLDRPQVTGSSMPSGVDWTPVDQVIARLQDTIRSIETLQDRPLSECLGRILAQDAVAQRSHPVASNSAVDGYGYADGTVDFSAGPVAVLDGRAAAGVPYSDAVPKGQVLRILTGAALPQGVDTVVLQEHVQIDGDRLTLTRTPPERGANTRMAGEDMSKGQVALAAGTIIRPQDIGLAAALGIDKLVVRPRLRVGVLSTGQELVQPEVAANHPLHTPDANRPMLLATLARLGFKAVDLGIVPDSRDALRDALNGAAQHVDAILTSGGVSEGDEDHVSNLLRAEADLQNWRIAIKPGRPLALAFWAGAQDRPIPIFGLPGNPVAAMVCALIFAVPALFQQAGAGWRAPVGFEVPADFSRVKQAGRREYLRARLTVGGQAELFESEGSGRISGLSWADGLVELPDGFLDIQRGDPVHYIPWSGFGL